MAADGWRREEAIKLALYGAWHTAAYAGPAVWGKRLPNLKTALDEIGNHEPRRPQPQEEQLRILELIFPRPEPSAPAAGA